ncbi:primase-like DNA-binding domain-containing protein [Salinirubellus litoreus]|uniref:primase-like DNA-binding domain-containing protein n=1 Tax=Salinirubellus sp. GCM10025818 TaxID=3252688 RepID=UPI0036D41037
MSSSKRGIEGRARLLKQGYFTNEARYGAEKRERWQAWGDSLDKFASECVERDENAERLTTGEVHRRYAAWCRKIGEKPVSQQQLTNHLKKEDVGYGTSIRINDKVHRGYKALGLSEDVSEVSDTPSRQSDPKTGGSQSRLG